MPLTLTRGKSEGRRYLTRRAKIFTVVSQIGFNPDKKKISPYISTNVYSLANRSPFVERKLYETKRVACCLLIETLIISSDNGGGKLRLPRLFSGSNEYLISLGCHSLLRRSYVKLASVRLSRSVGPTDVPVTPNSSGLVHGSDTGEKRGVAKGKGALCAPHSNYLFRHKSHYQLQLQN